MKKGLDPFLAQLVHDLVTAKGDDKEFEAKALFCLLNYCPPPRANEPLLQKRRLSSNELLKYSALNECEGQLREKETEASRPGASIFGPMVWLTMSDISTFETCPPILRMSVHRGRPEVAVVRSDRRE